MDIKPYHNGLHFLTQEEQSRFERYLIEDYKKALIYLKIMWNKHADKDFLSKFTLIHWTRPDRIQKLITEQRSMHEICAKAYTNTPYEQWYHGTVGFMLEGQVTFAGNGDLQTNQWSGISPFEKFTEYAQQLITNASNCKKPFEFVLANWRIKKIVWEEKAINSEDVESARSIIKSFANTNNIEIIDNSGNKLEF